MAYVEISHDDYEQAKTGCVGDHPRPTGRMRWWKPLGGQPVLQCEWSGLIGSRMWVEVPTLTEIQEHWTTDLARDAGHD